MLFLISNFESASPVFSHLSPICILLITNVFSFVLFFCFFVFSAADHFFSAFCSIQMSSKLFFSWSNNNAKKKKKEKKEEDYFVVVVCPGKTYHQDLLSFKCQNFFCLSRNTSFFSLKNKNKEKEKRRSLYYNYMTYD